MHLSLVYLCLAAAIHASSAGDVDFVTCGSAIRLKHLASGFHLHSHEVAWGSGSKQQSVTSHKSVSDRNSLWLITEAHGAPELCTVGQPVTCGSSIRLQHAVTRKNLHSHLFKAPLSGNQEVSAYGENAVGDEGASVHACLCCESSVTLHISHACHFFVYLCVCRR